MLGKILISSSPLSTALLPDQHAMQIVHRGIDLLADRSSLAMRESRNDQAGMTVPEKRSGISFAWCNGDTLIADT
jgi:hypothetical protein